MRLKYNGLISSKTIGCRPCGKAKTTSSMLTHKTFHLPSRRKVTVRIGSVIEVDEADGQFLLSYNDKRKVFEEI